FCGIGHAYMAFLIVADQPADFDRWVQQQRQAPGAANGAAAEGASLFSSIACAGCHTVSGTAAHGTLGPDLSHVASRQTLAARALCAAHRDPARGPPANHARGHARLAPAHAGREAGRPHAAAGPHRRSGAGPRRLLGDPRVTALDVPRPAVNAEVEEELEEVW